MFSLKIKINLLTVKNYIFQFPPNHQYLLAHGIQVLQFGPVLWPPACCLNAMSPSTSATPKCGKVEVFRPFLPKSVYTGPAFVAPTNEPLASIHWPSTKGEPALINTGRGAHSAMSSCASTGRSSCVFMLAYFMKFPQNQWYSLELARFSICSPKTLRKTLAPPAPDEAIKPREKRCSKAMATKAALPYRERPSMATLFDITSLSVSK